MNKHELTLLTQSLTGGNGNVNRSYGISAIEAMDALTNMAKVFGYSISSNIIAAPDAIPLSDSEYAGLPLGTNCSMERNGDERD